MKDLDSISASVQPLALRANMRAPLTHEKPLYRSSAVRAGVSRSPVNTEMVLKTPSLINPVDARTVSPDAFAQHFANRNQQVK